MPSILAHGSAFFGKTIFVESFLRPSEPFYRNLMMEANVAMLGDKVRAMFSEEDTKYTPELKAGLREGFGYTGPLNRITDPVCGVLWRPRQSRSL